MRDDLDVRVFVLGATGTAGRSTVPALLRAGHGVVAHARSPTAAAALRGRYGAAVTVSAVDAGDPVPLAAALAGSDAVVDHRIALRAGVRAALPSAQREYAALRGPALAVVVDAALAAGVPRLVRDLVSFVYADGGDAWLDEGSPVEVSGPLAANLAAEAEVARCTARGGAGIVLRCGQFYGPDDALSRDELRLARRRLSVLPGRPDAWHSALHVDDVGPAVVAALGVAAGVWNVVDDEPLRRRELASVLRQAVGLPASGPLLRLPAGVSSREPSLAVLARSQRVGAAAFGAATGWVPTVGSRRQGWPAAAAAAR